MKNCLNAIALAALGLSLSATVVQAQTVDATIYTSTSATESTEQRWVDFGARGTVNPDQYGTVTLSSSEPNVRIVNYYFRSTTTSGNCWELETRQGEFANGDTRIWLLGYSGSGSLSVPLSLDDDAGEGYYSKMRIFIQKGVSTASLHMAITAYSSFYNTMDFQVLITRLNLNATDCTNTTLPWMKKTGDVVPTFGNRN